MGKRRHLLVFGDIFPDINFLSRYNSIGVEGVFVGIQNLIQDSEITVGNLECAVTNRKVGIAKDGSHLRSSPENLNAFAEVGFSGFNLANNHSMDFGYLGLLDTMKNIKNKNMFHFGTRENSGAKKSVRYHTFSTCKIAIIGIAEKEFNIPTADKVGVNIVDSLEDLELIRDVKGRVDHIVILYHGGLEYYPYPTPGLQKRCRSYINAGADVVLCQHSHVMGASEEYNNGFILYGQGNSIMPKVQRNHDGWNIGLLVGLTFKNDRIGVELIPVKQRDNGGLISRVDRDEESAILKRQFDLSETIQNRDFVAHSFKRIVDERTKLYKSRLAAHGKLRRMINRIIPLNFNSPLKDYQTQKNLIECITHREILEAIWSNSQSLPYE